MFIVKFILLLSFVQFCYGGKLEAILNEIKKQQDEFIAFAKKRAANLIFILREEFLALQRVMEKGLPSIGFPVVDPLFLGSFSFSPFLLNLCKFYFVNLEGVSIFGLKNFTLENSSIELIEMLLNFNLTFSRLRIYGGYQANGVIMDMFSISGAGPFEIIVTKLQVLGTAKIELENGHLQIVKMGIKHDIKMALKTNFKGLQASGAIAGQENDIIQGAVNIGFKDYKDKINEWAVSKALPKLNLFLSTLNFDLLINDTLMESDTLPSASNVQPGLVPSVNVQLDEGQSDIVKPDMVTPGNDQPGKDQPNEGQSGTTVKLGNDQLGKDQSEEYETGEDQTGEVEYDN